MLVSVWEVNDTVKRLFCLHDLEHTDSITCRSVRSLCMPTSD